MSTRSRALLLVAFIAAGVLAPVTAAQAAPEPQPDGDYCVVRVTGTKANREFTTTTPSCYSTRAEALASEGVLTERAAPTDGGSAALLADFEIGYHCDGNNLGTPCISVVGSSCSGGWLNLDAVWNNRINSTDGNCPTIGHFDLLNLGGTNLGTGYAAQNLTGFENRTTSIQYS